MSVFRLDEIVCKTKIESLILKKHDRLHEKHFFWLLKGCSSHEFYKKHEQFGIVLIILKHASIEYINTSDNLFLPNKTKCSSQDNAERATETPTTSQLNINMKQHDIHVL